MLVEVKAKVTRIIDSKTRKRNETFIVNNCELFVEAEHAVLGNLTSDQEQGLVEDFEIQSLRISPIKEVCTEYAGESSFIATLKDVFLTDDGTEKPMKYKVLLWADSLLMLRCLHPLQQHQVHYNQAYLLLLIEDLNQQQAQTVQHI